MPKTSIFAEDILTRFDSIQQYIRQAPLLLGGASGPFGGTGGGPGGTIGQLPQTKVAADTTQSFNVTSGSFSSLLDNLNQMREWFKSAHQFWASSGSPLVNYLSISSGSWHYSSGVSPLLFTGGNTPPLSAPSSGRNR